MEAKLNPRKIRDIVDGFHYNELEGKGLYGLTGNLTIQPPYQDRRVVRQQLHAIVTQAEKVVRQEFPGTFQVPDVASYEATGVH